MTIYIRVKDPDTGHEFDVPEGSALLAKGLVSPVKEKRYPAAEQPRRPKHHLNLAGQTTSSTPEPPGKGKSTTKEN